MSRFLIGCERSGQLRRRLRHMGHDAYSCDLEPADDGETTYHLRENIEHVLGDGWDAMIVHPVCTFLTVANAGYIKNGCAKYSGAEAAEYQRRAVAHVAVLRAAPIPRWAIENPVGILSTVWRKPDQIVQPYQFGDDASKATCFWLRGFRPLVLRPEQYVAPRMVCRCGAVFGYDLGKYGCPNCLGANRALPRWANQTDSGQNRLTPSPDRARIRAETYPGIADAIAAQWGAL